MSHDSFIRKIRISRRKAICLDTKIQVLDRLAMGQSASSVGRYFGLHESTVRTIRKNEDAIRKSVYSGTEISVKTSSYSRDIILEKMEKALVIWLEDESKKGLPVNGNAIKQTALKLYKQIKETEPVTSLKPNKKYEFSASTGWLTGFLKRHTNNHKVKKIKSETAFVDELEDVFEMQQIPVLEIYDKTNKEHIDKEDPLLNEDLILEGLDLAIKLGNHFIKHDSNEERAKKFQRDLNLLMSTYTELYKRLTIKQEQNY